MQPFSNQKPYNFPIWDDVVKYFLLMLDSFMAATAQNDQILSFTVAALFGWNNMMDMEILSGSAAMAYPLPLEGNAGFVTEVRR